MEGQAMVAEQASCVCAEASLQEGEPVTLVIDDERFFGWVASASHAQRLSCVTVAFKRGKYPAAQRLSSRASGITHGEGKSRVTPGMSMQGFVALPAHASYDIRGGKKPLGADGHPGGWPLCFVSH
jgi:hypothetical protein